MSIWRRLVSEEAGQGMVEYGLILALVAVAAIGAWQALGGGLDGMLGKVNEKLQLPSE
jgi:pilus assembly protein Flp/PilA